MSGRVEFSRFSELHGRYLNRDLHVHTSRTDGENTTVEMVEAARRCGLSEIAVTDHVRRSSDWFADHARDIRAQSSADLAVAVGLETKILDADGTLDATPEMLAEADLVLGSVHRFPDGAGGLLEFATLSPQQIIETETSMALALVRSSAIDVLAHPGGMSQRWTGSFPESHYRVILEEAKRRAVAVELSSSYIADLRSFMELCREVDPLVSVGSDAHRVGDVGRCRDLVREFVHP